MLNHFFFLLYYDMMILGDYMKRHLLTILLCLVLTGVVVYKIDFIVNYISKYFNSTPNIVVEKKNQYAKNLDFEYVQITDDFVPYNIQDLLNIFYTILDSGYETFTFYCPNEYEDCVKDIIMISDKENSEILTTLGNYISPYNNFTYFNVSYDNLGEITVDIKHLYTPEEINKISNKIDAIWKEIVKPDMKQEDIIYAFHDYIINHSQYDLLYEPELKAYEKEVQEFYRINGEDTKLRPPEFDPTYDSNKAIGPLFQEKAICSGYTDTMAILLDKLGIKNFKVASESHVWNVVYINDEWLHIDLTWDDPVSKDQNGNVIDTLLHKFYLIDTKTLEEFKIDNHTYDKSIYLELK